MATITRSTFPDLLWPGIQAIFGLNYDALDKEYTRIFDVRRSTKAYEKVTEATGLGLAAVKAEGQSIIYDAPGAGPTSTFVHVTYGLGYIITREAVEDNQYQEVAENNAANLHRWINNPPSVKPGAKMPPPGLSEQELRYVVAYLQTLY